MSGDPSADGLRCTIDLLAIYIYPADLARPEVEAGKSVVLLQSPGQSQGPSVTHSAALEAQGGQSGVCLKAHLHIMHTW